MNRIRVLVNCEFEVDLPNGDVERVLYGSSTYFEAEKVETYLSGNETYANIYLKDGKKLMGVLWETIFENHGVPEESLGRKYDLEEPNEVNESREIREEESEVPEA